MAHLSSTPNSRLHQTAWGNAPVTTRVDFHQRGLSFLPDRAAGQRLPQYKMSTSDRDRDTRPLSMSRSSRPPSLDRSVPARPQRLPLGRPRNSTDESVGWRNSRDYHRGNLPRPLLSVRKSELDTEWSYQRKTQPTSHGHHSSEWETETLMDTGGSVDDGPRIQYPCPFRKRNPVRFNIRDHERCAKGPFGSMSELRSVISTQQSAITCRR